MKLASYSISDCYAALGMAIFLILVASGNAMALFVFSSIALIALIFFHRFSR